MAADSLRAKIALAKQQVAASIARIAEAQQAVDNTIIRAPFAGIVVSKDAQVGEIISPISAGGGFTRTGIATVVDMKSLEMEVDVNESYISRVTPGQRVTASRCLPRPAPRRLCAHRHPHRGPPKSHRKVAHHLRQNRRFYSSGHGHQGHLPGRGRKTTGRRGRSCRDHVRKTLFVMTAQRKSSTSSRMIMLSGAP